jgi:hypothetical protein
VVIPRIAQDDQADYEGELVRGPFYPPHACTCSPGCPSLSAW